MLGNFPDILKKAEKIKKISDRCFFNLHSLVSQMSFKISFSKFLAIGILLIVGYIFTIIPPDNRGVVFTNTVEFITKAVTEIFKPNFYSVLSFGLLLAFFWLLILKKRDNKEHEKQVSELQKLFDLIKKQ
jgi:TRAP-type C4-dicarboxylate transport system permease large subunit